MKTNVSYYDFRDTIMKLRPNNFSYDGLTILFDWLEEYEEDCGTEVDFDPIGICCEFSEGSWSDIAENYSIDLSDCEDDDDKKQAVIEHLQENTLYVGETESDTLIYAAF